MDSKQDSSVTVFRTFDDGYIVRSMSPADLEILNKWWLPRSLGRLKDVDIVHSLYPPGSKWFYVGEYQGEMVAAVTCVPWSQHVYHLSHYYVDAKYRKRGFGTRMKDEVATKHVGDGIIILDAISDEMASVYRDKNGFKDATFSRIKMKAVAKSSYEDTDVKCTLLKIDQVPFQSILDYDKKYFVGQDFPVRQQFLRQWTQIQGGATYVAVDDVGHVIGYGCRRPDPDVEKRIHFIGPIYAETKVAAEAILRNLCVEVHGETVVINYFSCNNDAAELLKKFDFTVVSIHLRQHLNGDPFEDKPQIYVLTSAGLCAF